MAQEKRFEIKVKRYLESLGCYAFGTPNHKITHPIIGYYEKRWGGGQFTKSGLPDMHVVIKGRSVELELKSSNGKPSELQLMNLKMINDSGTYGFILVESSDSATRLQEWIKSHYPQYLSISVIDFKKFKCLCEKLLTF